MDWLTHRLITPRWAQDIRIFLRAKLFTIVGDTVQVRQNFQRQRKMFEIFIKSSRPT